MATEKSEEVIGFLSEKWGDRACPMCNKGPWAVSDKVFQLMEYHSGGLHIGGPVFPVIPVACQNCGYTVLVSSIISGVTKVQAPEQKEDGQKKAEEQKATPEAKP